MQFIFHISDLHIGAWNKQQSRYNEYLTIFNKFIDFAQRYNPAAAMIVITGNIFHHTDKYSGADVSLFKHLITSLSAYQIVIIPGTHDARNAEDIDLIRPLIAPNVTYHSATSIFTINSIKFHHISFFDKQIAPCEDSINTILLYHGFINTAKYNSHIVQESRMSLEIANAYKLCLFGDIHEHQFIAPHCGYPGSLIQQSTIESQTKGFIIWNVARRTGQFVPIANDSAMLNIDLRGKTTEQATQIVNNAPLPTHLLRVSIVSDFTTIEDFNKQISIVQNRFGHIDSMQCIDSSKLNANQDFIDTLDAKLRSNNINDILRQNIIQIHQQSNISRHHNSNNKWTILRMEWAGLFKYVGHTENAPNHAPHPSSIDFTKFQNQISGIIGDNCIGKSSVIDILVFALYGEIIRDTKSSLIHYGAGQGYVILDLLINDTDHYQICRREDRVGHKSSAVISKISDNNNDNNDNKNNNNNNNNNNKNKPLTSTITETNNYIKSLIGPREHFFATSLYYFSEADIFRADTTRRTNLLISLLGINNDVNHIANITKQKKDIETKISQLILPRNDLPNIELKRQELKLLSSQYNEIAIGKKRLETNLSELGHIQHRAPIVIQRELDAITLKYQELVAQHEKIKSQIEIDVPFATEAHATLQDKQLSETNIEDSTEIIKQITILKNQQCGLMRIKPNNLHMINIELQKINNDIDIANSVQSKFIYSDDCDCCKSNKQVLIGQFIDSNANHIELLKSRKRELEMAINENAVQMMSYNKFAAIEQEIAALQSKIEFADRCAAASRRIGAAYKWEQYCLARDCSAVEAELNNCGILRDKLAEELAASQSFDHNKANIIRQQITKLDLLTITALQRIGALQNEVSTLQKEHQIAQFYNEQIAQLQPQFDALSIYEECLKSTQIKLSIINKSLTQLINSVNIILRNVANFHIEYSVTDNSIDFYICEFGGFRANLRAASGFQSAIISICFRLALTMQLPTTADFMIMDEPLQSVDPIGLTRFQDVIRTFSAAFKFTFIISHSDKLKEIIARPLEIVIVNNGAASWLSNEHILDNVTIAPIGNFENNAINKNNVINENNAINENNTKNENNAINENNTKNENNVINVIPPPQIINGAINSKSSKARKLANNAATKQTSATHFCKLCQKELSLANVMRHMRSKNHIEKEKEKLNLPINNQ